MVITYEADGLACFAVLAAARRTDKETEMEL
jgi:hypothetical protein